MAPPNRPRGPLPARVYWVRRALVLVVALGLVVGIARLLGGGGDDAPAARTAAADASTGTAGATGTPTATPSATATELGAKASPTPLAEPDGACLDSDVTVRPVVSDGMEYAGGPVRLAMRLTTVSSDACTWTVSPDRLVVKVTSGSDRVWSTQDCPGAVPKQEVVVRRDHPTDVTVTWDGQRSDAGCTRTTAWAEPGYYHVVAASFGSDPVDEQFALVKAPRPTVTATPRAEDTPTATTSGSATASPSH